MAEPITTANENEEAQKPTNAEDRKAAAALDNLNANAMSQDNGEAQDSTQPNAADQEALMKAMGRLEVAAGGSASKKIDDKKDVVKKDAEVKKKIKLAAEDIQFLVNELDLSKPKATELLRAHDGSIDSAVRSYVVPAAKA
ncbi:hypothetical protein LTR51_004034 [Lithohypha guttulata]|uniref:Nascent polypeptide-associated complex subunit alpha-like UBA domain-containing protein n=1 Tax=Lithohypha guttulata TaxID=1690604 RepID=A0AAN7YKR8_9EURO|nr:hypothetical protein LTR51_004034 [Lithohypha guttulata]KAK5090646.1 hypothetical protein LTR05_000821 [Lithohypha guttulata]